MRYLLRIALHREDGDLQEHAGTIARRRRTWTDNLQSSISVLDSTGHGTANWCDCSFFDEAVHGINIMNYLL